MAPSGAPTIHASVATSGLQPNRQGYGYSLGVLHLVLQIAAACRPLQEARYRPDLPHRLLDPSPASLPFPKPPASPWADPHRRRGSLRHPPGALLSRLDPQMWAVARLVSCGFKAAPN
jgi:hypothetical protein